MILRTGPGLDSCITSIFEPGNPGNATDSGSLTVPSYPYTVSVSEPATAADTVNAGLAYAGAVIEAASATDAVSVSSTITGTIAETATAASTEDATAGAGNLNTWNSADKSTNVSLSNGNLTAQATSSADGGVRTGGKQTSGKFYFEVAWTGTAAGGDTGCGISIAAANFGLLGLGSVGGATVYQGSGNIWYDNSNTGATLGAIGSATVCVAVDLTNQKVWFRKGAGNWNGNATHNPATNVGGTNIASLFPTNAAFAYSVFASTTPVATANFGATTFAQTVPSGFSAWNVSSS